MPSSSLATEPIAEASRLDLVAVTGGNRRLYARFSDAPQWNDLGGQLLDAPAIAVSDRVEEAYFVGVGTNRHVYLRTLFDPWRRISPDGTACTGVSAAVSLDTLAVSCRGTNGALYVATASVRPDRLPVLGGWRNLGGQLQHAPSTADTAAEGASSPAFRHLVVGTDRRVYRYDEAEGRYTRLDRICGGPVQVSARGRFAACRHADKGGLEHWRADEDAGASSYYGGQIVGRPGVAVDADGDRRFYVLGTDGNVYRGRIGHDGAHHGWTRWDGTGTGGLAAVSLT